MEQKQTQTEGYEGFYLERSGKDFRVLSEKLVAPPEFPLGEAEKQEIHQFEDSIYYNKLDIGMTVEEAIRAHKAGSTYAPRFFADAFIQGKVDLSAVGDEVPVFNSSEDVYKWLATCSRDSKINEDVLLQMSKDSSNYYKQVVGDSLLAGTEPDVKSIDYMSIVINPDESVKLALASNEIRQLLYSLRSQYKEGGNRLDGAKRALVDVYSAKVNSIAASDLRIMSYLSEQSNLIDDNNTDEIINKIIPENLLNALKLDELKSAVRLDHLRNGVGRDSNGAISAVDDIILRSQENNQQSGESQLEKPLFSAEQYEAIKSYMVSPQEMVEIFSQILDSAGLLSAEDPSTWSPKRKQRASDELFQVVINPTAKNFAIGGISGIYKVASESRSLAEVITIGGFHELEHINQVQNDKTLGQELKIAELKGKRVSMLSENGANFKQRQAERMLFGKSKPISLAYAKALKHLELGGSTFEATRIFYNEKLHEDPSSTSESAAKLAADRVLRLKSSVFSSQPMSYAEEIIMDQELNGASPEVKARAIAITSIDLVDQVRLHKYDILPMPSKPAIDWTEAIMKATSPYIQKALANQ